jgi:class I lanthipeptide synthase
MESYTLFNKYILRTPLCSFSFYKNLTKGIDISNEKLKNICKDQIIMEALFLASPSFFTELEKWLDGKMNNDKDSEKIKISLLKYLSRMSSRCTPFGLFAGTCVGSFSDKTNITLEKNKKNLRHTRLDMNYLVALAQDLAKKEYIKKQILFNPNTSIYIIGDQLRYIEYTYINGARHHKIVAVENSEYIQRIIKLSKNGASYHQLCSSLIDQDISPFEAEQFIDEIISCQLLTSDLEPSVSGSEFLEQILEVLKHLNNTDSIIKELEFIKEALKKIDAKLGNSIDSYKAIVNSLKNLGTIFDFKYLFQTDLILKPKTNELGIDVYSKIKKGINFLNKITLKNEKTYISNFSNEIYKRYESKKMSLSKVLDTEIGIPYNQDKSSGDNTPLIDDITLSIQDKEGIHDRKWSKIHSIFQKKIIAAIEEDKFVIDLKDKDFENFSSNWNDLPDTFSGILQLVNINGNEKIIMKNVGGSSAVNLLGRFCFGDENIFRYVQEIIKIEEEINKESILAEIIHLPESRVGNILARPSFRKYEIPYLAKSFLPKKNHIKLEDLTIRRRNNEIILESKKLDKIILPRLSNAHNFSYNSLPIYHFLCNLQTQNKRDYLGVNLNLFEDEYSFLPRIEYNDIILSLASWYILKESIKPIIDAINHVDKLIKIVKRWRDKLKIPQYIILVEGDNELLINLKNITSIKMFLTTIKNKSKFKFSEFIFDRGVTKDITKEEYTNQMIVSFYKK